MKNNKKDKKLEGIVFLICCSVIVVEGGDCVREEQLEKVMNEYTGYLLRIGFYYTNDLEKAKDFAQDVFVKFYYADYVEQGQVKAYLARLMTNRCKDYLRSWSYRKLVFQQVFQREPVMHDKDGLVMAEERTMLDEAIMNLNLKSREVLVFYYLEGMTTREIANVLHTPESTVKSRLKVARAKLKEQLDMTEWEVLADE